MVLFIMINGHMNYKNIAEYSQNDRKLTTFQLQLQSDFNSLFINMMQSESIRVEY